MCAQINWNQIEWLKIELNREIYHTQPNHTQYCVSL